MNKMNINTNLLHWIQFFLIKWNIHLMLDDFFCLKQLTNNEFSQKFSIFFILFVIYLSRIFKTIKSKVSEAHALFFADDIEIVISKSSVRQICDRLQKAVRAAEAWSHTNVTQFDIVKTKTVLFTQKQKCRRRKLIQKTHITIRKHKISFN